MELTVKGKTYIDVRSRTLHSRSISAGLRAIIVTSPMLEVLGFGEINPYPSTFCGSQRIHGNWKRRKLTRYGHHRGRQRHLSSSFWTFRALCISVLRTAKIIAPETDLDKTVANVMWHTNLFRSLPFIQDARLQNPFTYNSNKLLLR